MFRLIKNQFVKRFDKVKSSLEKIWVIRLIIRTFKEFGEDEATDRAGAVAYYSFLSIFPLLLGVVSILGFFLPSEAVQQEVFDAMQRILPGSTDLIEQNISSVIRLRGSLGVISIITLIWSGSALFSVIDRTINRAWDIKQARNFFIQKLRDIGMVASTGILLLLSMFIAIAVTFLGNLVSVSSGWVTFIAGRILGFFLLLMVFVLIYKYVPNTKTRWRFILPGAFLAAILFEVGREIFLFYLANFASYQLVYGSLATIIVLLFSIYVSAIILILGVEFSSEYSRMVHESEKRGEL